MWFSAGRALIDHFKSNMLPDEDAKNKDRGIDISVVIPSYNHALYITEAIDSVLGQTFGNWELIVIDDGSTDGTRALLDKAYAGHSQIRLIYQKNHGAHHAINQGMSLATGRYISILNSDDVYHPERLQTLLTHCDATPFALAFTPLAPIDAHSAPISDEQHPWSLLYARLVREYEHDGARQALLTGNFAVTTSNFFFRTDILKTVGGFRKKRYNHDWDFMTRLVRQGLSIVCVGDKPLLSYRLHGRNTITQNTLMARLELKQILHSLVPPQDPYLAKLVTSIQTNMRSIRREHQARIVQQVRSGYDNHIQSMLIDLQAQHAVRTEQLHTANQALTQENQTLANTRESLLHQTALLEQHLTQIHNSRTYRFAQRLSRMVQTCKKLLRQTRA
jgi:glycosyltransferase involved in cell wall biosynthesis